jgi:16S rRNA (cytosine967-C5)-methyltransferase
MGKSASRRPGSSARWVATSVLQRVAVDAAYAARALDAALAEARLGERDARLATEIVYGTLRALPAIDARLDAQLARGRPDPLTYAALRGATYQALYLSRVPDFAIVQETVAIVKAKRGEGLARLANAVLRRVVAERPAEPLPQDRLQLPVWMLGALEAGLGDARMQAFLDLTGSHAPPLGLRVSPGVERAALLARLRAARPDAELWESQLLPDVLQALRAGDPRTLPGFAEGQFAVQDAGAGLVGALLGARPGERLLDACAGRGGKTMQLLAALGGAGEVTAVDIHARKLALLSDEAERLGLARAPAPALATETIDLALGAGGLVAGFDRALVDAPCTGLGTLRRRPEIALRLTPEDPARMAELQLRILDTVVELVRPGGILVFAVCSASQAEGGGVADRLEARRPRIRRLLNSVPGVPLTPDNDGVFRIGPHLSERGELPDVYQVVRWEVLDSSEVPV